MRGDIIQFKSRITETMRNASEPYKKDFIQILGRVPGEKVVVRNAVKDFEDKEDVR